MKVSEFEFKLNKTGEKPEWINQNKVFIIIDGGWSPNKQGHL